MLIIFSIAPEAPVHQLPHKSPVNLSRFRFTFAFPRNLRPSRSMIISVKRRTIPLRAPQPFPDFSLLTLQTNVAIAIIFFPQRKTQSHPTFLAYPLNPSFSTFPLSFPFISCSFYLPHFSSTIHVRWSFFYVIHRRDYWNYAHPPVPRSVWRSNARRKSSSNFDAKRRFDIEQKYRQSPAVLDVCYFYDLFTHHNVRP